jgi:hypothetical protein
VIPASGVLHVTPTAFDAVAGGVTKTPAGLLLAAGAGRRFGTPKALVADWLTRGIDALAAAECGPVVVVLGAAQQQARERLHGRAVTVAVAADWSVGLSASDVTPAGWSGSSESLAAHDVGQEGLTHDDNQEEAHPRAGGP